MNQIRVTITGLSPLLCNRFTDENAEAVRTGTSQAIKPNQNATPRQRAEKRLYVDEKGVIYIPGPNVYRSIIDAGTFVKVGKSKLTTQKTSIICAGATVLELACPLAAPEGKKLLWEVDERAVVIPSTGGRVMAYRPRFEEWRVSFTIEYDQDLFSDKTLRELVDLAGKRIGLGDFRPSRKGPFGRYSVTEWKPVTK